jgi:hypothetical protein
MRKEETKISTRSYTSTVYTILYYVYMRNINITLQLLHSELPYILLNFDFLYYQCRVA